MAVDKYIQKAVARNQKETQENIIYDSPYKDQEEPSPEPVKIQKSQTQLHLHSPSTK